MVVQGVSTALPRACSELVGWVERSETHRTPMTAYRRNLASVGSCFFTANLADRRADTADQSHRVFARGVSGNPETSSIRHCSNRGLTRPPSHDLDVAGGDADFALRWRLIKTAFSRSLSPNEAISESRFRKGECGIWQRRYWEHTLRDETDFQRRLDYIHSKPVKHGHVAHPEYWPYSSLRRWSRLAVSSNPTT
jgi:putative transposase